MTTTSLDYGAGWQDGPLSSRRETSKASLNLQISVMWKNLLWSDKTKTEPLDIITKGIFGRNATLTEHHQINTIPPVKHGGGSTMLLGGGFLQSDVGNRDQLHIPASVGTKPPGFC